MLRVTLRSAPLAFCVAVAAAGCTRDTGPVQLAEELAAALAPGFHGVIVTVLDPNQSAVPGTVVTATNTVTGEYFLKRTGPTGIVDFELPDGSYLIHARNLQDTGPVVPPFPQPLVIAPLPPGSPLISTGGTQGLNQLGVLYDPNAASGWVPLDPPNYSRLTVDPALILSGPPSIRHLLLQFITGSDVTCTFVDETGNPVSLPTSENVFVILPLSGPIPPPPPFATGVNLPRGILLGVTTAPAGATGCQLSGFASGGGFNAVIETNPVPIGGEDKVFVANVTPGPGTVEANLVAEPRRASIGYLFDPFGDNIRSEDIGLTTYGWEFDGTGPTDDFTISTRFQGPGDYLIHLRWIDPATGDDLSSWLVARCTFGGCSRLMVEPRSMEQSTSVTGATFGESDTLNGTVNFTFNLPGVTSVQFRVFGYNRLPRSDNAPDQGYQSAVKGGTGNTWLIPGD